MLTNRKKCTEKRLYDILKIVRESHGEILDVNTDRKIWQINI